MIEELALVGSKGLLSALYAVENIGWSIVLLLGVLSDRVKVLCDAFTRMIKDEQFLKDAEKLGLEIGLIRGEEMNRDIEAMLRDERMMDLYRKITFAS